MCLARAYSGNGGEKELLMEEIASLKVKDGKIVMRTLFGEQKEVAGSISEVDFTGSNVYVKKAAS